MQLRGIMQKKLTTSVEEDASVSEHYNEVCKREARVSVNQQQRLSVQLHQHGFAVMLDGPADLCVHNPSKKLCLLDKGQLS